MAFEESTISQVRIPHWLLIILTYREEGSVWRKLGSRTAGLGFGLAKSLGEVAGDGLTWVVGTQCNTQILCHRNVHSRPGRGGTVG